MMDNFEKHIRENKALFDEHHVDRDKLWNQIENRLEARKPRIVRLWSSPLVKLAASILLVLGMGTTIGFFAQNPDPYPDGGLANKELLDIDMHYKILVSHQVQLVKNHPNLTESDKAEFLSFIDELDQEYDVLRLEMDKNLDNEIVLEAIVQNYKKRIELIENLLKQINDSKKSNDDYGYTL